VTTDLRTQLTAAYADVSLGDPLADVVRRGRRIRRARRARRAIPALVAAAAVVVGVTVVPGGDAPTATPIQLVGQQTQTFPLSFAHVPAGLSGPSLSLDPSFRRVAPGWAHAGWTDPKDPASSVGISVSDEEPDNNGDEVADVSVHGQDATVYRTEVTGAGPHFSVVWKRAGDQWVTVGGEGRFASKDAVVGLARQVVDRPTPVPLQLTLAPRGWVVVAYKDDRVLTLADPAGPPATDATSRTLNVYLPQPPTDPADLSQRVTGGRVPAEELSVHGRPAYLLPGSDDTWFLQTQLADGTVFDLQTPGDFTRQQVIEVAGGVSRP
jgi:hypothetical protein